jgi:hypothetical protein
LSDIKTFTHLITFFDDHAARVKYERELTLPQLAEIIGTATAPAKEMLRWLKFAAFGDVLSEGGSLRHKANVSAVSGGELDYDSCEVPFEAAFGLLRAARVRGVLHTSPSYKKGEREKWRFLFPFSKMLPPKDRAQYVAVVIRVLSPPRSRQRRRGGRSRHTALSGRIGDAIGPADPGVADRARPVPPYRLDGEALIVGYILAAELRSIFLKLGGRL